MKTRLLMIILSIVCGLSLTTSVTSITLDVVDDTKEELEVITPYNKLLSLFAVIAMLYFVTPSLPLDD